MQKYFTNVLDQLVKAVISVTAALVTAYMTGSATLSLRTLWIVIGVFLLTTLGQAGLDWYKQRRAKDVYGLIVLTEQAEYPALAKAPVERFFEEAGIKPAASDPLVMVERFSKASWARQLEAALRQVADWARPSSRLHLVCATPWLWAFALGTRLGNTLALTIYHRDDGQIYPVGDGMSKVQARLVRPDFTLTQGTLARCANGTAAGSVALIVAIGRDESDAILRQFAQEQSDLSIWCYRNEATQGKPKREVWLQSAAELAHAIEAVSEGGKQTVYLLGSAPAALALLAGSAVKRFRKLQLWHFSPQTQNYRPLLDLPLNGG